VVAVGSELIEGGGVVDATVLHHQRDVVGVADVVDRVGVEHHQVAELARLLAAEIGTA